MEQGGEGIGSTIIAIGSSTLKGTVVSLPHADRSREDVKASVYIDSDPSKDSVGSLGCVIIATTREEHRESK
jgi:hypothetical protein